METILKYTVGLWIIFSVLTYFQTVTFFIPYALWWVGTIGGIAFLFSQKFDHKFYWAEGIVSIIILSFLSICNYADAQGVFKIPLNIFLFSITGVLTFITGLTYLKSISPFERESKENH